MVLLQAKKDNHRYKELFNHISKIHPAKDSNLSTYDMLLTRHFSDDVLESIYDVLESNSEHKRFFMLLHKYAELYERFEEHKKQYSDNTIQESADIENVSTPIGTLSDKQIEELLLKQISIGDVFYPSDFADRHNLDHEQVINVVKMLRDKGTLHELRE